MCVKNDDNFVELDEGGFLTMGSYSKACSYGFSIIVGNLEVLQLGFSVASGGNVSEVINTPAISTTA